MTDHYQANTTRPVPPQDTRTPAERGATVVNNDRSNTAGWAVALLIAVALGIGAVFMFTDFSPNGDSVDVDVTAPTSSAPTSSAPTSSAPAAPAPTSDAAPTPAAPATPAPSTDAAPVAPAPAAPAPSTTPAPAGQ